MMTWLSLYKQSSLIKIIKKKKDYLEKVANRYLQKGQSLQGMSGEKKER